MLVKESLELVEEIKRKNLIIWIGWLRKKEEINKISSKQLIKED